MAIEIKEIGNIEGSNPGFIRELILIRKEDIVFIKNPINAVGFEAAYVFKPDMLSLADNAEVTKINFVWRSCSWNEESEKGISRAYANTIGFELSKSEEPIMKWVIDNEKHEFIVFFGNRKGQTFIIGNTDVGLELNYSRKLSPKNFMAISLAGIMTVPTFHASEIDLDSFFEFLEFSNEFNVGEEFS